MGFIAIAGCGALGGAVAHKLAGRDRAAEVRLVDPEGRMAQGKALDILQSSPVERFTTRITSADAWTAAAGADVIVIADEGSSSREHAGEPGLAVLRQIAKISGNAPIVFAGAAQRELMARVSVELKVPRKRLIGSAPFALESAVRSIAAVLLDGSGVDVSLRVVGVPPNAAVVTWEQGAAGAVPLRAQLGAHEIAAINGRLKSLWPPGPYALASAATRVIEGLLGRSRRRYSCFVPMERGPMRDAVVAMPVELGPEGTRRIIDPALTRQEQTLLENAFEM